MNPRAADPAAALRRPLWWAALATLVVNDHLLKGAGLLPGWITGKLSDVAGMIVAPALAASLIPLRHKGLRALAFLAVAALFAAVKVSPEARDALVAAAAALGMRWRIVVDPTDTFALAALPLAWSLTAPRAGRRVALQRSAMALGFAACMATSRPAPEPGVDARQAVVWVANTLPRRVNLTLRFSSARFDCAAARISRGALFTRALFDDERVRVALDPRETFPLDPDGVRDALRPTGQAVQTPAPQGDCAAVLLTAEGLDETVVVWPRSMRPTNVAGFDTGAAVAQRLALTDEGGAVRLRAGSDDVSTQPLAIQAPRCARRGVGYAWSDAVPAGAVTLRAVDEVPGGCLALALDDGRGAAVDWMLCVPRDALPFAPGDRVSVRAARADQARGVRLDGDRARLVVWRDVPSPPRSARPTSRRAWASAALRGPPRRLRRLRDPAHRAPRNGARRDPGEDAIPLGDSVIVRFGRAEHVLATRDACGPRLPTPGAFVDYAVTTRGP
ncbi:MAG: hypothetical protein U0325_06870 [Polyangiales bacterium]